MQLSLRSPIVCGWSEKSPTRRSQRAACPAPRCQHSGVPKTERPETPDFAAIFGEHPFISPRMAYRLWAGAQFCGDTWRLTDGDVEPMLHELPPVARRWATGAWLDRFIRSFDVIEQRLGAGDVIEFSLT